MGPDCPRDIVPSGETYSKPSKADRSAQSVASALGWRPRGPRDCTRENIRRGHRRIRLSRGEQMRGRGGTTFRKTDARFTPTATRAHRLDHGHREESNSLEEVQAGIAHDEHYAYTEYTDRKRDHWLTKVVPALKKISLTTWERESGGKSRRILIDARRGRRRPHRKNQELLISVARKLGLM